MPNWKKAIYFLSMIAAFKLYSAYNGESSLYSKSFMNIDEDSNFEEDYKSERVVASEAFPATSPAGRTAVQNLNQANYYTLANLAGYWKILKHETWEQGNPKEREEEFYTDEKFFSVLKIGLDKKTNKPFLVMRSVNQNAHAPIKKDEQRWQIFFFGQSSEGKGIAVTSSYKGEDGRDYIERLQLKSTLIRFISKVAKKKVSPRAAEKSVSFEMSAKLLKSPFNSKFHGPDSVNGSLEVRDSVLNLDLATSGLEIPGYDIKNISISNAQLSVTSESMSTAVVDTGDVPYSITVFKKQLSVPGQFERVLQFIGGPYNNLRVHFSEYDYEKELKIQEENLKKAPVSAPKQVAQKPINPKEQFNQFRQRAQEYQEEYSDEGYEDEEYDEEEYDDAEFSQAQVDNYIQKTGYSL